MLYKDSDYYVIRQPMPYVLKESNAYLMETGDGWAVVDVGVNLQSTRDIWTMAVREAGIPFASIKKIYITHSHPDHLGASAWLQQVTGAQVYLLDEEIKRAQQYIFMGDDFEDSYLSAIKDESYRQGFAESRVDELVKDWHHGVSPMYPEPAEILPLYPDQEIELTGEIFQVVHSPAHSDGLFGLWCPRKKHLFSSDIAADAYLHFTDWPNTNREKTLADTMSSFRRLLSLGEMTAFPGHGKSFTNIGERIIKLLDLYERRLEKVLQAVKKPVTAGELYTEIWELTPYVHLHRVTLGETLGYLNELADRSQLRREETDRLRFSPD